MRNVLADRKWLGAALFAALPLLLGGAPRAPHRIRELGALQATPNTHILIVGGVGGDPQHSERFVRLALEARTAFITRFGVPDSLITVLAEATTRDPRAIAGRATRDAVRAALQRVAASAAPNERVLFLFIGHGTGQLGSPQLALVGPDLTPGDLRDLLDPVRARPIAIVLAASASGDFVRPLAAPGRIVITATKSGAEQNASLFAEYFVAALQSDGADADKDDHVSLLELFTFARREVARAFESRNRLRTEHALLDDNGDGTGLTEPAEQATDGTAAHRLTFVRAGTVAAANDPRAAPLIARRESVTRSIDSLRSVRQSLTATEYDRRLEDLLVELAQIARSLRELSTTPRRP
ncbi:MAG: hypothetical protein ACT4R6_04855 [Gemmatimonadaceae bacterium]